MVTLGRIRRVNWTAGCRFCCKEALGPPPLTHIVRRMTDEGMKSFKLCTERLTPVTKFAGDYSSEEQRRFLEVFRPRAEHYRRYSRRILIIGITAFILWSCAIKFFPGAGLGWVCGPLFIGLIGLVVLAWYTQPLLECPACHNPVDSRQLGRYCPECGRDQLRPGVWFLLPSCNACGKKMYRGKTRGYKIRSCTHCGVLLDENGV